MSKNARWGQKPTGPIIMLAAGSTKAQELFGGMTLQQVGQKYDLSDDDLEWYNGENPKTHEPIRSVLLTHDGITWNIPISKNLTEELMADNDILMNCVFRPSFLSVKEADGVTPKTDENGAIVLNESKPYLSFGKPGIVLKAESREKMFNEPVESDVNDKVGDTAVKS